MTLDFKGKTIGVISIKGGVGKTTTVVNLAHALSTVYGKKVLAVDANFSSPNLGLHVGLVNPPTTLFNVLKNENLVTDAIYEHEHGFHVLPTALINYKINPFMLKSKISSLKKYYDYIIIDSSPNLNSETLAAMLASDELLVISTPDVPTLSCTLKAIKTARDKGINIAGIILNKVENKKYELSIEEIESTTSIPVIGMIPYNNRVIESLSKVSPVTKLSAASNSSVAYNQIAAIVSDSELKQPNVFKRMFAYAKDDFDELRNHDFSTGYDYFR